MKFAYTIIYVRDVEATLNFYVTAFNGTIRFLDDTKQYGELETGGTRLAFASEECAHENMGAFEKNSINKPLPAGFEIAFSTDDVQKAYEHAINSGARSLKPPLQKPWGQIVAFVLDLNGIVIELCTVLT